MLQGHPSAEMDLGMKVISNSGEILENVNGK